MVYKLVIFLLACLFISSASAVSKPEVGGPCIFCTLIISVIEQLALIRNQTVVEVLDEFCLLFPNPARATCDYYVATYGEDIVRLFEMGFTPDGICHGIDMCDNPTCKLWPDRAVRETEMSRATLSGETSFAHEKYLQGVRYARQAKTRGIKQANEASKAKRQGRQRAGFNPWQWLEELINRFGQNHEPIEDFDGDFFSGYLEEFRGSGWRGKDCHDFDGTIYPGRKNQAGSDPSVDYNCNGIYQLNGVDYEKAYCANSGQMGAIIAGDSAGAHFHIPPDWMNASAMNEYSFSNLLFAASMELDWPQLSAWTGYMPSTQSVPVDSIYLRLRQRNQCNHRDFQNLGVNGMRSGATLELLNSLARNQSTDQPVIFLLELIGNDVCSGHPDFDHMTTVPEFRKNILAVLQKLDTMLPKGSHVAIMGLAKGSTLWDLLHARLHPIGTTYANVYAFLNCLEMSPCWTWMNSNKTVRDFGDARAANLSAVYPELIQKYGRTFKNFDLQYYDFPLKQIEAMWKAKGGQFWQLIEPCDGFHPNQQFNALLAEYYWQSFEKLGWIGKENPHNKDIATKFGNQGGY